MLALAQQTTRFTTHPSSIGCNKSSISRISSICANGTHGARTDVGIVVEGEQGSRVSVSCPEVCFAVWQLGHVCQTRSSIVPGGGSRQ